MPRTFRSWPLLEENSIANNATEVGTDHLTEPSKMTTDEAKQILRSFNEWINGSVQRPMYIPKGVPDAIDVLTADHFPVATKMIEHHVGDGNEMIPTLDEAEELVSNTAYYALFPISVRDAASFFIEGCRYMAKLGKGETA